MQKLILILIIITALMLGAVVSINVSNSSQQNLLADGVGDSPTMP